MLRAALFALMAATGMCAAACGEESPAPPGATADSATLDGRGLYATNCARCHGGDLKGTSQGPPLLDAIYRPAHHPDIAFQVAVKNGVRAHHWNFGPMAPVPGLTERQVAQIIAFVREEQQAVGIR